MAAQGKSLVTDIEYLSKTRNSYQNELSFAGLGLKLNTRDDVKDIVSQILKKEKIEVLRLEGNTISPEAADELSKALVKHPELERFIGNDIFTSRSKEEIPPALKSICGSLELCGAKLVEINMSDNAFGPIGLDALVSFFQSACCYSLKEIRMHNNGLGPQGATKFAHALDKCYENSGGKLALKVFVCGRNRLEFEGARTIGNTLKTMGTLEEIQMPQNGIRPNAIEFLAEACANNPNLRVINFNDNTFRKIGAVLMGKSLDKLNNVEYINFGDCLIRSKGALEIARALQSAKNLKEVILSFNEISLQAGIEIAQSFLKNKDTLKMLDLNGNKFGEEGKLEIKQILQPLASVLCTLSEDEGSDEEEEEEDEDEVDEESEEDEDEEGEEEEEVDEDDDYDQVDDEDYEDYEGEYDEERDEEKAEQKFGGFNIAQPQQPSLFSNFKGLSIDNQAAKPNLFTNLVNNSYLLTSIEPFDAFVKSPNLENLKNLDENLLKSVLANQKFNGSFLIRFLVHLSKVYDSKSAETNDRIFKCASFLTENYLTRLADKNLFADEVLIEFGFLKSEDKHFKPVELTENLKFILQYISKQSFFPSPIKDKVVAYLTVSKSNSNPKLKERNCDLILNCFS